jgi:hypothetical protein
MFRRKRLRWKCRESKLYKLSRTKSSRTISWLRRLRRRSMSCLKKGRLRLGKSYKKINRLFKRSTDRNRRQLRLWV